MFSLATPLLRLTTPSVLDPSTKDTVPIGVGCPSPAELTVATKVTFWPRTEGSGELDNVTVGAGVV